MIFSPLTLYSKPQDTFESGIKKTVQWYLDNEEWWRNVMDGSYQQWISEQYGK